MHSVWFLNFLKHYLNSCCFFDADDLFGLGNRKMFLFGRLRVRDDHRLLIE